MPHYTAAGDDPSSSPPSKASLMRWWKAFKAKSNTTNNNNNPSSAPFATTTRSRALTAPASSTPNKPPLYQPPGRGLAKGKSGEGRVFGVSPEQSLKYAAVAISTAGADGRAYVYGYVPIVVAKCGMMLKESATATEGIFRVSGSNKRINQLQALFDEPPRYGKDLDWTGYTVHDAASVLRRYLNMMPEPVIPANLYLDFVHVLQRGLPEAACVAEYQRLISLLPPTSRYLLLYLLDFLSVFVRSSHLNLMTASNLAVVFQPGLVSTRREGSEQGAYLGFPGFNNGPTPNSLGAQTREGVGEHGRGKEVLEFLIEQQSKFMIGLEAPSGSVAGRDAVVVAGPRTSSKLHPKRNGSGDDAEDSGVAGSGLTRRGSEKSVERRRLRKAADGSNGKVKRSRTLPGRGSSITANNTVGDTEMMKSQSASGGSSSTQEPSPTIPPNLSSSTNPAPTSTKSNKARTSSSPNKTRSSPPRKSTAATTTTTTTNSTNRNLLAPSDSKLENKKSYDTMYTAQSGTNDSSMDVVLTSTTSPEHAETSPKPKWIPVSK